MLELLKTLLSFHDEDYKSISTALQKSLNTMQEHLVNLSTAVFDMIASGRAFFIKGMSIIGNSFRDNNKNIKLKEVAREECLI